MNSGTRPASSFAPNDGDCHAAKSAKRSEQDALGQQLSHQSKTTRAQRSANGQFLLAFLSPGKRQIRDVCANDEEHESNRREQAEERALQIIAAVCKLRARWTHPKAQAAGPAAPFLAI